MSVVDLFRDRCTADHSRPYEEDAYERETLQDLYIDELKDLYSAENQIIKALPKMVKAATPSQAR